MDRHICIPQEQKKKRSKSFLSFSCPLLDNSIPLHQKSKSFYEEHIWYAVIKDFYLFPRGRGGGILDEGSVPQLWHINHYQGCLHTEWILKWRVEILDSRKQEKKNKQTGSSKKYDRWEEGKEKTKQKQDDEWFWVCELLFAIFHLKSKK